MFSHLFICLHSKCLLYFCMNKITVLFLGVIFFCAASTAFSISIKSFQDSLNTKNINDSTAIIDTLVPLHTSLIDENSFVITNKNINKIDYRYLGDILNKSSFNYTLNFGFVGQPNIPILYGVGYNGISFLQDGILINNRYSNFADLNDVQSEILDSVEIINYPRGFLYSSTNNLVSVNLISKDFVSPVPYSKIKYYQGPDGEALADVYFNSMISNKVNFSLDITNRKMDDKYFNTNFSYWQGTFKIKYLASNSLNVVASYNIEKSIVGMNGGVDIDSIKIITQNTDSLLYDNVFAPVNFVDRSKEFRLQNFNLKFLYKFSDNLKSTLSAYYRFSNERIVQTNDLPLLNSTNNEKLYGFILNNKYENDLFNLNLISGYESADINSDSTQNSFFSNRSFHTVNYFTSVIFSSKIFGKNIVPSVFYKYQYTGTNNFNKSRNGYGADLTLIFNKNTNLYIGLSSVKNDFTNTFAKNYEGRINYKYDNFNISGGYFFRKDYYQPLNIYTTNMFYNEQRSLKGVSLIFDFSLGDFIIESNGEFYSTSNSTNDNLWVVPKQIITAGLYYYSYLFNDNMLLKAGVLFTHNGIRNVDYNNLTTDTIPSFNRIDLTISGIIQKVATIYFTWENLTNKKYFIVPFYPMPERNIRFGISWELFN